MVQDCAVVCALGQIGLSISIGHLKKLTQLVSATTRSFARLSSSCSKLFAALRQARLLDQLVKSGKHDVADDTPNVCTLSESMLGFQHLANTVWLTELACVRLQTCQASCPS